MDHGSELFEGDLTFGIATMNEQISELLDLLLGESGVLNCRPFFRHTFVLLPLPEELHELQELFEDETSVGINGHLLHHLRELRPERPVFRKLREEVFNELHELLAGQARCFPRSVCSCWQVAFEDVLVMFNLCVSPTSIAFVNLSEVPGVKAADADEGVLTEGGLSRCRIFGLRQVLWVDEEAEISHGLLRATHSKLPPLPQFTQVHEHAHVLAHLLHVGLSVLRSLSFLKHTNHLPKFRPVQVTRIINIDLAKDALHHLEAGNEAQLAQRLAGLQGVKASLVVVLGGHKGLIHLFDVDRAEALCFTVDSHQPPQLEEVIMLPC
mmetsp:Transcript_73787/g.130336  ORF Transcript_73787/g.130336 Transcript_73787/m.130336 type:complete len:325 (-) Transcript_73787:1980-2954(-)